VDAVRVSRRDASARMQVFGNVLARDLGLRLVDVVAVRHEARHAGRTFDGVGPCVVLDGLEVTRLLFDRPLDALEYLEYVARPGRSPLVVDARGRQAVVLSGRRLVGPERAARVLVAAWADEVLDAPDRPVEALRVASPPLEEAAAAEVAYDGALFLGRGDTPAWSDTLAKLRAARTYAAEAAPGGPVVRFVSTNHFTFESTGGGCSDVAMTRTAAVAAVGRTPERCRAIVAYGRDLLEALAAHGADAQGDAGESPATRMLQVAHEVLAPPTGADLPDDGDALGR
jgi:hypothetical protein